MNKNDVRLGMVARMNCNYGTRDLRTGNKLFMTGDLVMVVEPHNNIENNSLGLFKVTKLTDDKTEVTCFCRRFDPI